MKSSLKIHAQASFEQFEVWNPSELLIEVVAPPAETQKEQILAIFRGESESHVAQPGNQSVLHKNGIAGGFSTWQPGEMKSHLSALRKAEWNFVGPAEVPYQNTGQYQSFKFNDLGNSAWQDQSDMEEEASIILEQARNQAEEIILAAQAEADNILLQAQEEIEEQKKEAYQQSREQVVIELGDTLKATQAMVEEVQTWKRDLLSQGETILVEMLKEIAQKMFGEGVELNSSALQINLNRIMEDTHGLGNLNIFLNPRDAKTLDPSWSEYQMLVTGDKVKIIPSSKITPGGCFVKGNMGNVDARVETQLEAILATFEEDEELTE